jgi:primosomal protein N' (replication factor Y)
LVRQTAEKLADQLKQIQPAPFELLGPSPATIMRVARRYRWHLLLKLPADGSGLPDWMTLRSQIPESVSLTIDVDPLNLL